LSPLQGLFWLGGSLEVVECPALVSLEGLESLEYVSGDVRLGRHLNPPDDHIGPGALTSTRGLDGLHEIEGHFQVDKSTDIVSLEGLEELRSVGGRVLIQYCDQLRSSAGLRRLETVGWRDDISEVYLWYQDLPVLDELGLISLRYLHTGLGLQRVHALGSVAGLAALEEIDEYLFIDDCDALTDLDGLESLGSVGHDVEIEDSAQLTSLMGLRNLYYIGRNFEVNRNASLAELGLDPYCEFVGPSFLVRDNPLLPTSEAQALADAWTEHSPTVYSITISGNQP